jgi:hypothetical protein
MARDRKLPEGVSDWTMRIIDQLPDEFIIQGGNEALESIRVRGTMGVWGVVIQYDFNRDDRSCYIKGTSATPDHKNVDGVVPIAELRDELTRAFSHASPGVL